MRITAQAKEHTRRSLLDAAHRLFARQGFDATTTRDLAAAVGVANGTVFNYFPTKEALALRLFEAALDEGLRDFERRRRSGASFEEDLFALIMAGLRRLEPFRSYAVEVFDAALNPFSLRDSCEEGARLKTAQVEAAMRLLADHGRVPGDGAAPLVVVHLYWTLYLGVLAYWARDGSRRGEDTLVLLDQTVRLFASAAPPIPRPAVEIAS